MIISPQRRYIFVHAPKTGGTSMALALEARAKKDDMMLGDTPKAKKRRRKLNNTLARGRLWKHSTLADIDGLISDDALAQMFVFTMVRNPWDRLVSYYHWLRVQKFSHPAQTLAMRLDFDGFAQSALILDSLRANPAQKYVTCARGVDRCSAYIRLEHLHEDLPALNTHLGFSIHLPHANASQRAKDARTYYTPAARAAVARACAVDIARFGYEFDEMPG